MQPLVKYQSVFPEWCLGHLTYFNFSRFYWNNLFLKDVMFKHMQFKKEQTFCRLWNLSESSGLVIFLIVGGDIPAFFFRSCDILNLRDKHCSQSWLITRQTQRIVCVTQTGLHYKPVTADLPSLFGPRLWWFVYSHKIILINLIASQVFCWMTIYVN